MNKFKRLWAGKGARPSEQDGSSNPSEMESSSNTGQFRSIIDEDAHLSYEDIGNSERAMLTMKTSWKTPFEVYKCLSKYEYISEIIEKTGLTAFLKVEMPMSDRALYEAVVLRWWDSTHTFHLPTCEIGITPLDFTMLSGISVGGEGKITLPKYSDKEWVNDPIATLNTFFPYYTGIIKSGNISSSELSQYLQNHELLITLPPVITARVFIFYLLGTVFFPNAGSWCPVGWLNYLLDMDNVSNYDWGSAILARIYSCLDAVSRGEMKNLSCFWQIIEYFFYEYMATSCPLLKSPHLDVWPRIHRWVKSNLKKKVKGIVRNKADVTIQQIEMRSIQSIIWQPYQHADALHNPINETAANLSRLRVMFLDPQMGGYMYLGDRCYHQVYGQIAIPHDPPKNMGKISRRVFDQYVQAGWPDCNRFVHVVSAEVYKQYFGSVSRGPTLPSLSRGVNTDMVGYAELTGGDVELPCTPLDLQGRTYNTQGASSSSDITNCGPFSYERRTITGELVTVPVNIDSISGIEGLDPKRFTKNQLLDMFQQMSKYAKAMRQAVLNDTTEMAVEIQRLQQSQSYQPSFHNTPTQGEPFSPFSTPNLGDY